ncbi:MAG: flagellar biosynthesis protein FlgJ [Rhodobacteraceae bacterium]|nr:flagellar biosynthesis protein FlgJ [Paracoccaceae bacterium]
MLPPIQVPIADQTQGNAARLRPLAQQLEVGFLAEMLNAAGFGKSRDAMGGGAGEDNFASFLVHAEAEQIVRAGGFGLTESILQALMAGERADG